MDFFKKNRKKLIDKLELKKCRNKFELIENDEFRKEDIIINADEISDSIINELSNGTDFDNIELKNKFRILRQYTVSIPIVDMPKINNQEIQRYKIKYIDKTNYSEDEGILRQSQVIW